MAPSTLSSYLPQPPQPQPGRAIILKGPNPNSRTYFTALPDTLDSLLLKARSLFPVPSNHTPHITLGTDESAILLPDALPFVRERELLVFRWIPDTPSNSNRRGGNANRVKWDSAVTASEEEQKQNEKNKVSQKDQTSTNPPTTSNSPPTNHNVTPSTSTSSSTPSTKPLNETMSSNLSPPQVERISSAGNGAAGSQRGPAARAAHVQRVLKEQREQAEKEAREVEEEKERLEMEKEKEKEKEAQVEAESGPKGEEPQQADVEEGTFQMEVERNEKKDEEVQPSNGKEIESNGTDVAMQDSDPTSSEAEPSTPMQESSDPLSINTPLPSTTSDVDSLDADEEESEQGSSPPYGSPDQHQLQVVIQQNKLKQVPSLTVVLPTPPSTSRRTSKNGSHSQPQETEDQDVPSSPLSSPTIARAARSNESSRQMNSDENRKELGGRNAESRDQEMEETAEAAESENEEMDVDSDSVVTPEFKQPPQMTSTAIETDDQSQEDSFETAKDIDEDANQVEQEIGASTQLDFYDDLDVETAENDGKVPLEVDESAYKIMKQVLNGMMEHPCNTAFKVPTESREVDDLNRAGLRTTDFFTIQDCLSERSYSSLLDSETIVPTTGAARSTLACSEALARFQVELSRMWENTLHLHGENSAQYQCAQNLSKFAETVMKEMSRRNMKSAQNKIGALLGNGLAGLRNGESSAVGASQNGNGDVNGKAKAVRKGNPSATGDMMNLFNEQINGRSGLLNGDLRLGNIRDGRRGGPSVNGNGSPHSRERPSTNPAFEIFLSANKPLASRKKGGPLPAQSAAFMAGAAAQRKLNGAPPLKRRATEGNGVGSSTSIANVEVSKEAPEPSTSTQSSTSTSIPTSNSTNSTSNSTPQVQEETVIPESARILTRTAQSLREGIVRNTAAGKGTEVDEPESEEEEEEEEAVFLSSPHQKVTSTYSKKTSTSVPITAARKSDALVKATKAAQAAVGIDTAVSSASGRPKRNIKNRK